MNNASIKLAYIVIMYPRVSHTFVQNEIWALREQGVDVQMFSIRKPWPGNVLSERDRVDAEQSVNVLPLRASVFLDAHLRTFLRHPAAVIRTLADAFKKAPRSLKAKVWAMFYVLEALVVWRRCDTQGIRHLHAHFANVASDVARIAARFGNTVDGSGPRWTWSFTMHGPTEFSEVSRFGLSTKTEEADGVVCISDYCRSQLMLHASPAAWNHLQVIHCGIDVERFPMADRSRQGSSTTILCVGRLVPEKAQVLLVQSVAALRKNGSDVNLILVGDGPERDRITNLAHELGITDALELTGSIGQDEISSYYRKADIFCLPSFAEGVPMVLMEAMSTGLPVVTTKIAGIPELVQHNVDGVLVAPGNIEQLTAALDRLILDSQLRATLGASAAVRVGQQFNVATTSKELAGFFADVTSGKPSFSA